ncbi:hypothetical protein [Luteibacter aegosomatissinici]|uniref:hypothetical protein n=1 Tax=Luteibacter aegosomatissinici TaxID=2911539 RepID=UPI001FFBED79|nr:hypothetical protein [Luteibacter aegosomatissinici]UPG92828.1 hypothetical protein L2Y97_13230 [Luteibacter aegosomatissinici]
MPLPDVRVGPDDVARLKYPAPFPPGVRKTPVKRFTLRFEAATGMSYVMPYLARRDYTKR